MFSTTKISAQESEEKRVEGSVFTVVEFSISTEKYAIESLYIHEVFPLKALTEIPGVPDFIIGVVNVRGQIVSVVDIRRFFDLPEKGFSDLSRIIILRSPEMEYGVLADTTWCALYTRIRNRLFSADINRYSAGIFESDQSGSNGYPGW